MENFSAITIRIHRLADHKLLIKLLTSEKGILPVIYRRSKKSRGHPSLNSMALTTATVVSDFKGSMSLIKGFEMAHPLANLYSDIRKSTITLFIAEVLDRVIEDNYINSELFEYVWNSVLLLDQTNSPENFHVCFLWRLLNHLGIQPKSKDGELLFNEEWSFLDPDLRSELVTLDGMIFANYESLEMSSNVRKRLLLSLLKYMEEHFSSLSGLKSLDVLQTVFADD